MLEQVVSFTQARHGVLAGNLANVDTPGYKTRDLSPEMFQERLQEALEDRRRATPSQSYSENPAYTASRSKTSRDGMERVRDSIKSILYHDQSNVSMEKQVAEISKNHAQHNMALTLMNAQFRLLRAAVTERV
jgi:flagellar basal-body rod protein FlgB